MMKDWIETHNKQYALAEKIAGILGISHVQVLTTSHEQLIEKLVEVIERERTSDR